MNSKGSLHSYGNTYEVKPALIRDSAQSARLKKFIAAEGEKRSDGKSYYCHRTDRTATVILDKPDPSQCCLELAFSASDQDRGFVEKAMVFENLRQIQGRGFSGSKDPAFRIQRFNGFTTLMGGAESVDTFRSGVNYYKEPAYGYQGMDYILNSLVSNPALRKMVSDAEKELKTAAPSILCQGVDVPGVYQIDSDYYFDKHRDSKRLDQIAQKFAKGKNWDELTERERRVMARELGTGEVMKILGKGIGSRNATDMKAAYAYYFKTIYPERSSVGKASDYRWDRLTDVEVKTLGKNLRKSFR